MSITQYPMVSSYDKHKSIVPWSILFSCSFVMKILGGISVSSVIAPIVSCLCLLVLLCKVNFRIRIYMPMLWFLIYIPIALLIARPDPVFHSWSRLIIFTIVVLLVSPVIQATPFVIFRQQCLFIITLLFIGISVISFICYFLGVNYMLDEMGESYNYLTHPGGFGGITRQSMALGIVVACSVLGLIWLGVNKKIWWILLPICLVTSLFAASRGAVIIMVAGGMVMIFMLTGARWRRFVKYVVGLMILGVISFPLWRDATASMVAKGQGERKDMGRFESRTAKIGARYEEFLSSPIFGVGFAAIDVNGLDRFDETKGVIEPGSSWMAVLSMTGIIGLCFMLYIIYDAFRSLRQALFDSSYKAFLMGVLVLWVMGMLYEGYIFAGGSPFCVCMWLAIGMCKDSYVYR